LVSAKFAQSLAERRRGLPFDCAQGTGLGWMSEVEAFALKVPGLAFGDLR